MDPKKRWLARIKEDLELKRLNTEDALNRKKVANSNQQDPAPLREDARKKYLIIVVFKC